MSTDVRLPQLADSIESVKFVSWLVHSGDKVVVGQPIAEVETDKATMEIEAPAAGVVGTLFVQNGTEAVRIGTVIAQILSGGAAAIPESSPKESAKAAEHADALSARATAAGTDSAKVVRAPSPHSVQEQTAEKPSAVVRRPATPLAARMATLAALDLETIPGEDGTRIRKVDIDRALGRESPRETAQSWSAARPPVVVDEQRSIPDHNFTDVPLTAMRRVTATRLQESKRSIPHFYLQADCCVDELVELRAQLNRRGGSGKLTVTDFVIVATSLALRAVPVANSAWVGDTVRVYKRIDIAIAVNTPKGLVTPIVRDCANKSLAAISKEVKRLSERARDGRLTPEEYTGGTFTISNLGMFGLTSITPIINPPQSCILGVGSVESRPVVVNEKIAPGHLMSCTLAADHRAIDGAAGAELLAHIRRLLESPLEMTLHL
ncbi:MAG: dihydrolipoamide acetyltransferase family protein [Vicinamibacterales bacterium]